MQKVLVRVAPEINIKTPKIKARFLRCLVRNIKAAFEANGIEGKIEDRWSRLHIEMDSEAGIEVLGRIFGIGSISPVDHECASDLETVKGLMVEHYTDLVEGKSFCVRVKRSGVKGFTSHEAERYLGSAIAQKCRKVDLVNPELTVEAEMTTQGTLLFTRRIPGPGGLPLGSQAKALCMISGGFDSAVAAWRMMKRGVSLDYVFCNVAGGAYERSVLAVVKGLCDRWAYGTSPKIHIVDFSPVVSAIAEHVNPHYSQVVLKRQFYRASAYVARYSDIQALVTGEAVGQVSSQTLQNLAAIDAISDRLILRPLISFDKEEILEVARDIGTYVLCEHIQEYCALNNKRPVTSTSVETLDHHESHLPEDLMETLKSHHKVIKLSDLNYKDLMNQYLFTNELDDDTVIIDTRPKSDFQRWHYEGALHLPMAVLMATFKKFDKKKRYVLVCDLGLQTAVAAEQMQKQGFEAYSFERGARGLKKLSGPISK